jgi:dolichol-phosphate mannosyltransferase
MIDTAIATIAGRATEPRAVADLWVCLPTYNEAPHVERVVTRVLRALDSAGLPCRILVIDDASPDGTGQIADALAARESRVEVLHRARKEGLGPAYLAGFRRALAGGAQLVAEMDCDLSHEPEALPRLVAAAARADVVLGSRYVRGGGVLDWSALRRAISRGGCWYARRMLGTAVRDLTGGFKVFRRGALETVLAEPVRTTGYGFQIELTHRALRHGFAVAEVPIVFRERRAGASKMTWGIVAEAALLVPRLRAAGHAPPLRPGTLLAQEG